MRGKALKFRVVHQIRTATFYRTKTEAKKALKILRDEAGGSVSEEAWIERRLTRGDALFAGYDWEKTK